MTTLAHILVGTYTRDGRSEGLYWSSIDLSNGSLSAPVLAHKASNPTFCCVSEARDLVVIGCEVDGKGAVEVLSVLPSSAGAAAAPALQSAGLVEVGGAAPPCHVSISGNVVLASNYHQGLVAAVAVRGELRRLSVFEGKGETGPVKARQDKPHIHSATFLPGGRHALVFDLGTDRILGFAVSESEGLAGLVSATATAPGDGPRHGALSLDSRFLYVANELSCSVSAYRVLPGAALELLQSLALNMDGTAHGDAAEVVLHPTGRFLYVSNRGTGADAITTFKVDPVSGQLEGVESVASGGKHPRNFNITPCGRWMVVANKDSDNVVAFAIDQTTGKLTKTANEIKVPQAVRIQFF
jgi:6-phosphogluconolactonase